MPVQAELNNSQTRNQTLSTEIYFEPPEEGEMPYTAGAGTRNPDELRCESDQQQIKGIMPTGNYGLTLEEHPSIFVYLPQTSARQVVLAIQDETETYHEIAFLPINTDSTIVSFSLPQDKAPLTPDTYYKWKLTLVCGDIPNVEDPYLEGWVKRIDGTTIQSQIRDKSPLEKADWYGKNGYWYDLLMELQQAKQADPNNTQLTELWEHLLENSGVGVL